MTYLARQTLNGRATLSKSTMETPEQCVKFVQSQLNKDTRKASLIDVSIGAFIDFKKLHAGWDVTKTNKTIMPVYVYKLKDIFFPHKIIQFRCRSKFCGLLK